MTNCTSLFYLIIIASLFSCKNGGQQKSFANKDSILRNASMEDSVKSKSNRDSLLHRKSSNEIANDKTQNIDDSLANSIVPSKIKFNFFALRKIVLKEPFSSEEALQKLFPGHYYKLEVPYADKDTISLVAWSCPDCPKHKFFGYFSDDSLEIFPLKDSNETRIADTLQFKDDNGKRNIILSFSTTPFMVDLLGTGRFSGDFFSLAFFTEENHKWVLKAFTPALGYYGSFQDLPQIHLIKFGKNNFGCYFKDGNGPAGGPYYYSIYAFGIVDKEFKLIFNSFSGRTGSFSNWDSKIRIDSLGKLNFDDLTFITKGNYSKQGFDQDQDDTANTPDEIKNLIKKNNDFYFTIKNHFKFQKNEYIFEKPAEINTSMKKEKSNLR